MAELSTLGSVIKTAYEGQADTNAFTDAEKAALAAAAPLDSPALTGTPTAPTASSGTNTTQIATTAFVQSKVASVEGTAIRSTGEPGGTKFLREDGDGTCSWQDAVSASGATFTGLVQFSGTDHYGLKLITLTTVQRDALTPSAGMVIYNSTTGNIEGYDGTTWLDLGAAAGAAGDLWSDPVDADIVPDTDSTWDLGSSANKFAVLHVDQIDLNGTVLDGTNIALTDAFEFIIDNNGSVITTGLKGFIEVPFACTITAATLLADQSGSIVVDVWKDTYANFPPTVADTITASAKPTISAAQKSQDTTLTGWTTTLAAGDILAFNVDSASTVTRVTLSLKVDIG